MNVADKVILITGASAGIGRATAELLGAKGARLALAARSEDNLGKVAAILPGSFVVPVDMTQPDQVRRMVEKVHAHFGRLDVLVNNAGQGMHASVEHMSLENFAAIMDLNVYGPIVAMQAAIPLMRAQSSGSPERERPVGQSGYCPPRSQDPQMPGQRGAIVNVSSRVSHMRILNLSAYAATKCALNMISLTAREELAAEGIVVSVVYPGLTATEFQKNSLKSAAGPSRPFVAGSGSRMPVADPPEKVAAKILEAIETGAAEVTVE
jgi:NAD(P)-dependent dehydrogenase (short-subunit alcohol dehydrogenase family)